MNPRRQRQAAPGAHWLRRPRQRSGSVEATAAAAGCSAARAAAAAAGTAAGGTPELVVVAAGDAAAAAAGHGRSSSGSRRGRSRCREGTSRADPSKRGALKSNERAGAQRRAWAGG